VPANVPKTTRREAITLVEDQLVAMITQGDTDSLQLAAARQAASHYRTSARENKKTFFVNCWHMDEAESSAMWKLYTYHQSVCTKSSYSVLAGLLPDSAC
jgi:hypothetical protein